MEIEELLYEMSRERYKKQYIYNTLEYKADETYIWFVAWCYANCKDSTNYRLLKEYLKQENLLDINFFIKKKILEKYFKFEFIYKNNEWSCKQNKS